VSQKIKNQNCTHKEATKNSFVQKNVNYMMVLFTPVIKCKATNDIILQKPWYINKKAGNPVFLFNTSVKEN